MPATLATRPTDILGTVTLAAGVVAEAVQWTEGIGAGVVRYVVPGADRFGRAVVRQAPAALAATFIAH